jgi:hypothetical protein
MSLAANYKLSKPEFDNPIALVSFTAFGHKAVWKLHQDTEGKLCSANKPLDRFYASIAFIDLVDDRNYVLEEGCNEAPHEEHSFFESLPLT